MSYYVTYAGETNEEHGLLIYQRPNMTPAEENITTTEIPGREEYLTERSGIYASPEIEIIFNYASDKPEEWGAMHRDAMRWLRKSGNLIFSDDPDVFYKVLYVKLEENERTVKRIGKFSADFVCRPGAYFTDGAEFVEISTIAESVTGTTYTIYNGWSESRPAYRFMAGGTCTLTVNGNAMSVIATTEMVVDTNLKIAYDADGNVDGTAVSGDYDGLVLIPGENVITITSGRTLYIQTNYRMV